MDCNHRTSTTASFPPSTQTHSRLSDIEKQEAAEFVQDRFFEAKQKRDVWRRQERLRRKDKRSVKR